MSNRSTLSTISEFALRTPPKACACRFLVFALGVALTATALQAQSEEIFSDGFESGTICFWDVERRDMNCSYSIPTNPTYTGFLETTSICGEVRTFGEKQTDGLVTSAGSALVDTPADRSLVQLDEQGRPARITVQPNGTVLEIDWTSATTMVVSAISPSGDIQVNVAVDLENPEASYPASPEAMTVRLLGVEVDRSARDGIPVQGVETPPAGPVRALREPMEITGASSSDVYIERCFSPVSNAMVFMTLYSSQGPLALQGVSQVAPGQYRFFVPQQGVAAGQTLENICLSIASVLDAGCTWFIEPIATSGMTYKVCLTIAAAVDLIAGGPTGEGALIYAGCLSGFKAAELYCKTAGASPVPGAPSVQSIVCEQVSEIVDLIAGPNVTLTATGVVPGHGSMTESKAAPAVGPFPDFFFQFPDEVDVASLWSVPPDPAPFESYVATAQIVCAPPGTVVTMSIWGTDGYSDWTSCTVEGDDSCSLWVPGAMAGIVDTVSVSIDGVLARQIVLVF